MGECKEQMTSTTQKAKDLFGKIAGKTKKGGAKDGASTAKTFCDKLAELDTDLEKLLTIKETDLNNEKGKEAENREKLAFLQTIRFHLDSAIENASQYSQ